MEPKRGSILCGVDGSADSDAALHVATQLAERLGSRLVLAHVAQPVPMPAVPGARAAMVTQIDVDRTAAEELLEQTAAAAGLEGVETRVASGIPAERLADLADDERAALIVVGSRGRGAFRAAFLGSVSNELIGVARCPVLVVPRGATAGLGTDTQEYWAAWQHASSASRSPR
ncbi:MAG TPA: universal stress protein [Gaiellaceae bacterium]|jgi:nucleotide-binding universal stress UspA family protein|nr:universal stress protein [Gaiellaceae bacterium]